MLLNLTIYWPEQYKAPHLADESENKPSPPVTEYFFSLHLDVLAKSAYHPAIIQTADHPIELSDRIPLYSKRKFLTSFFRDA